MFGDLFAEEEDEESAVTVTNGKKIYSHSSSVKSKKVLQEPPLPRGSTGLCGLINQGGTCYLNSLIQTLFFTPEFRECLFQLGPEELGVQSDENSGNRARVIPLELQHLFAQMLLLNKEIVSTSDLTESFGWTGNQVSEGFKITGERAHYDPYCAYIHAKLKVSTRMVDVDLISLKFTISNQQEVDVNLISLQFTISNQQKGFQQHDVQELNRILFSAIESSLVGTSGHNLIRNLYHGTSVSKITCQECGKVSEREEDFLDLQMVLTGCSSLNQSLEMFYVMPELMEGSNQYMCEACNKLVNAIRSAKLRSLPSILTFSLVRFTYDLELFERHKETKRYAFPLELDMGKYSEVQRDDDVYELFSVVIHKGSCYGGHYHAYIHDIEGLGIWVTPDKQVDIAVNTEEAGIDVNEYSDPVQLITAVVRKLGGKTTVSDLCQYMSKETGVSWNQKYKKQYGPMTKFVKKHTDVFEIVNGTLVTLRCSESVEKHSKPSEKECNGLADREKKNMADSKTNHLVSDSGCEENRDKNDADILNKCHWFDLNDTKVSCISEQDIKKQFAGKESAYMLFYRRKSLQKSKISRDSFMNSLPARLVSKIYSENCELQSQREEYDLELNRITVLLNFVCDFTVKDGVIVPKEGIATDPAVLTLDRRKTVSEFLAHVTEWYFHEEVTSHEWTVHTAERLPAGLHLYQDITTCKTSSLKELHVSDGSELFIWNGKQVDGHTVRTGLSCEPVLLSIIYPVKGANSLETQKPFPKDSTLGELKVAISTFSGIKPSKLILSIMKSSKRSKTKVEELVSSQDGSTLKELDFRDGQRLVVDKKAKQKKSCSPSLCLAKTEAEKHDNEINILVENRCAVSVSQDSGLINEERPAWSVVSVNINKYKTIKELKDQIVSSPDFQITTDQSFVVRVDDPAFGLGPPLYDHQRLEDVLFADNPTIVVEHGIQLTKDQITVRFYCTASSSRVEQEIILEKSASLKSCLRLMTEQAGLEGSNWHLCKTNWYGEAADIIENEDATLDDELIKNGDMLVVEPGRLPPKGFIRLSLWLLKRPEGTLQERNGVLSWITAGLQDLLGVSTTNTDEKQEEEFAPLGELEISQEDTLLDLKVKINTILQREKLQVSCPECLRIQEIKNGFAGRVLRSHHKTVRFLKLSSTSKLSVQLLPREENLSPSAILLNVRKRIPGKRQYGAQQQLIFDPQEAATPSSLRHFISESCSIPVERLAIAKYLRHKHDWIVLTDDPPSRVKNKKGKMNLRHSPYHLQDGDTLGIKDTSHKSSEDVDDFSTCEDDAVREKLKLAEEEKIRRRREERSKGPKRRPEVELKIHVEDFTKQLIV